MRYFFQAALSLCLVGGVSVAATAGEMFPGYFTGSVGVGYIASKHEILSAGQAKYHTYLGNDNYTDPFIWDHKIQNTTAGALALRRTGTSIFEYNQNHRIGAMANTCYRATLAVSEGCVGESWGSSTTCAPQNPDPGPGGIPETLPGDGTGDGPDPRPSTPIVIDPSNDGFRLSSYAGGAFFDLNADSTREWTAWTDPAGDEAFLALDRNLDGRIDSGIELFGDRTPQPLSNSPNGFEALAVYDQPAEGGNGDGLISGADLIFSSLLLWRDANHDGVSQPGEIEALNGSGIEAIEVEFVLSRRRDRHGNQLRWASRIQRHHGWRLGAADVIFTTE